MTSPCEIQVLYNAFTFGSFAGTVTMWKQSGRNSVNVKCVRLTMCRSDLYTFFKTDVTRN